MSIHYYTIIWNEYFEYQLGKISRCIDWPYQYYEITTLPKLINKYNHISDYVHDQLSIIEIILPIEDPDFKIKEDINIFFVNIIIMGNLYSLEDINTYLFLESKNIDIQDYLSLCGKTNNLKITKILIDKQLNFYQNRILIKVSVIKHYWMQLNMVIEISYEY